MVTTHRRLVGVGLHGSNDGEVLDLGDVRDELTQRVFGLVVLAQAVGDLGQRRHHRLHGQIRREFNVLDGG